MNKARAKNKRTQLGPVGQKILILLAGGLALSLTQRPNAYFKISEDIREEWESINRRSLHESIKKLYQSKLIDYKENEDGTVTLILSEEGKQRALRYNLDSLKIKKPSRWDGLWRIVIFDIPEHLKKERNEFAVKLKQLGFYSLQKSVFIYPHNCKSEVDFVVKIFNLRPYVRFILADKTDVDLDLKDKFDLN